MSSSSLQNTPPKTQWLKRAPILLSHGSVGQQLVLGSAGGSSVHLTWDHLAAVIWQLEMGWVV